MNRKLPSLTGLTPQQKRDMLRQMLEKKSRQDCDFPLSQHQLGMWFLARFAPENASYNTALAVEASPPLDIAALTRALDKLVERHPALRTSFHERGGSPIQTFRKNATVPVCTIDTKGTSDDELKQAVIEDYRRPFDLEASPMRVTLFRREGTDLFMVNVHHIVFDAWSANILYRELPALYDAERRGAHAELSPIPETYRDFVAWQSKMLESDDGRAHWQYWSERLSGNLPVLDLPLSKEPPAAPSFAGGTIRMAISPSAYEQIKELVRAQQTTVFSVVAAAYSILLHRLSGQSDLIIGTAVSGRTQPQWAELVGDFINMLPMRFKFPDGLTAVDHLQVVSTEIRNALGHQDFPFPLMVERLRVPRDQGHSPIFQAMINVHVARAGSELRQLFDNRAMPFGDSLLRNYEFPQQEGQYDLSLEVLDTGEAMFATMRYSEDAFDAEAAEYIAAQFASLLEQIAAQPDCPIGRYVIEAPPGPSADEHFVI